MSVMSIDVVFYSCYEHTFLILNEAGNDFLHFLKTIDSIKITVTDY